jgi:uncharacterized protein YhbP (UPF0306 family)
MDDLRIVVNEILQKTYLFTLGTSQDNIPWTADLIFVHDDQFNLYWISSPDARHSQDILKNETVSATITLVEEGLGRGIQIQGAAEQFVDNQKIFDIKHKHAMRMGRQVPNTLEDALNSQDVLGKVLYKLIPTQLFVISEPSFSAEKKEYIFQE